jgi:hypothetical protein
MYDTLDHDGRNQLHAAIISQIWEKMAPEIYAQYLKRGRGVLVFFMTDEFPPGLEDLIPDGKEPTGKGAVGAYIPRDQLLPLEGLIGEQGLLATDRMLGEYDPETTIVCSFIEKGKNSEGKTGTFAAGYSITPPPWVSPRAMYEAKARKETPLKPFQGGKDSPLINLN